MFGAYGGASANAAVSSAHRAYDRVGDRKQKQEQADQLAKMNEEKIRQAQLTTEGMEGVAGIARGQQTDANGVPITPSAEQKMANLEKKNAELQKQQDSYTGDQVNGMLSDYLVAGDLKGREQTITMMKNRMKRDPRIAQAVGVKNIETVDALRPDSEQDRQWITNSVLGMAGITPESEGLDLSDPQNKDLWDGYVTNIMNMYPAIKSDGIPVDVSALVQATGAHATMSKEKKQAYSEWETTLDEALGSIKKGKEVVGMEAPTGANGAMLNEEEAKAQANHDPRQDLKNKIEAIENPQGVTGKNKSGYEGPYQFRYASDKDAGTAIAKKLGYTPEEIRQDRNKQEEVMDVYLDQNATALEKKGHEASPYNMWLAHNQGAGGANAIITGKLTDTIRKNMKNQGVDGDTDEELIANYHAKFKPKMGVEESAGDAPMSKEQVHAMYSLAGMTPPKDASSATLSRAGKMLRDMNDAYDRGDKAGGDAIRKIMEKQGRTGTASKDDADKARASNKLIQQRMEDGTATEEDRADFAFNNEVIQGYEKTTKEQNTEAQYKENVRADSLEVEIADEYRTFKDTGTAMSATSETKLKQIEQIRRKNNPESIPSDRKKLDEMNGKRRTVNGLAKVINRLEDGDLKGHERGVVENPAQWISRIVGVGDDKESQTYLQDQADKSIKLRSRIGIIQANYIKAMSGTAASDAERQFLTDIIGSGTWDDETALHTAVKEFYNSTVEDLQDYRTEASPYNEYKAKLVDLIKSGSRREQPSLPTREQWKAKFGNDDKFDAYIASKKGA